MPDDLSRRQTLIGLAALSAVGTIGLVGCNADDPDTDTDPETDSTFDDPTCEDLTKAQTAGPFYPGEPETRMDLREDRQGVQLDLDLLIVEVGSCAPIVGAEVDVWGADASGTYSGYDDFDTVGETWLRGQQITDDAGTVMFTVIVPGAYPGRAVHLHVKVRAPGRQELTTQLYLPDALVDRVLDRADYDGSARQTDIDKDDFYEGDTMLTVTVDEEELVAAERRLVV